MRRYECGRRTDCWCGPQKDTRAANRYRFQGAFQRQAIRHGTGKRRGQRRDLGYRADLVGQRFDGVVFVRVGFQGDSIFGQPMGLDKFLQFGKAVKERNAFVDPLSCVNSPNAPKGWWRARYLTAGRSRIGPHCQPIASSARQA